MWACSFAAVVVLLPLPDHAADAVRPAETTTESGNTNAC